MTPARCAVIGNPIAQSRSPELHRGFARERGLALSYERILAPDPAAFVATVRHFFAAGGRGLNITAPFKEEAFRLADRPTAEATAAGAVNTLWPAEDGALIGHNTDGLGLCRALDELAVPLTGARLLLIGAGGAARGIGLPLLQRRPAVLTLANRSRARAEALRDLWQPQTATPLMVVELAEAHGSYDLILNAASTGLHNEALPLSPALRAAVGYELSYGKETPFMAWARAQGCPRVYDGFTMLVAQARLSFNCWFPPES